MMNGVIAAAGRYISTIRSFLINEENNPRGMYFRSDGLKLYLIGWSNDTVYQYSLSSAWDITTVSYDNISFLASSQVSFPVSVFFSSNGTKMYLLEATSDVIFQYTLSTSWNISTATYDNASFSVQSEQPSVSSMYFRSDGLKFYVIGGNTSKINQYTLSTAWDIGTASYDNVSINTQIAGEFPNGLYFKPDGLNCYVVGTASIVAQFTLTTAWDVSTATYDNITLDVNQQDGIMEAIFFKNDGFKLYVLGNDTDSIYEFSLTPAWDI